MVSKNGQPTTEDMRRNGPADPSQAALTAGYSAKVMVDHGNNGWCTVRSETEGRRIAHWWVIETPTGMTSPGECIFCHKRKEFYNAASVDFTRSTGKKGKQ